MLEHAVMIRRLKEEVGPRRGGIYAVKGVLGGEGRGGGGKGVNIEFKRSRSMAVMGEDKVMEITGIDLDPEKYGPWRPLRAPRTIDYGLRSPPPAPPPHPQRGRAYHGMVSTG